MSSAWVALDFFDVLDTPILSGRAFHSGDLQPGARTVIVNQSFAQVVLGGNNPIGRRLRYSDLTPQNAAKSANQPWHQVVGVVRDFGIDPEARRRPRRARIYHPLVPGGSYPVRMAVHTMGDPLLFAPRLRSIARDVEPTLQSRRSPASIKSLPQLPVPMTLLFWLFLALAFVVVLLSLTGIYSVLSFTASQRTREVGIRVALGGRRRARGRGSVSPPDDAHRPGHPDRLGHRRPPVGGNMVRIIAVYGCVVVAVSALATLGPVRRALRIQPIDALRAD